MKVLRSTNLGKSFKETKSAPAFPKEDGRALANIWSLEPGSDKKDLLCGVEPASLFQSEDGGDSWEMVPGISNHDHARKWQPGNGGLCMHTIIRDGKRVHLGISTGRTLPQRRRRRDVQRVEHMASAPASRPIRIPSSASACTRSRATTTRPAGSICRTTAAGPNGTGPGGPRPDIGVLRSDDHGHTWRSIAKGLPSDFGFPIVVHPHDPDTIYVVPLEPRDAHVPRRRSGRLAERERRRLVEQARRRGCPKKESFFTVLRDAMDIDRTEIAGALPRHHHRPALDRARRGREVGVPVRFAAAHPLREGGRGLIPRPLDVTKPDGSD